MSQAVPSPSTVIDPIVVPNPLPANIVALSAEMLIQISDLEQRALAITEITSTETYDRAEEILRERARLEKEIEAKRKEYKAPVLELGCQIDAAAGEGMAPLLYVKQSLGAKVIKFRDEENARREAARRLAEAEAMRRQQALLKEREEREARERQEAAERERVAREAAASDPNAALPPDEPPAEVIPVRREPTPTVLVERTPAPLRAAAVGTRNQRKVVIYNPALVPDVYAGVPLRILDEKAITKQALAGPDDCQIPGVRIELVPILVSR